MKHLPEKLDWVLTTIRVLHIKQVAAKFRYHLSKIPLPKVQLHLNKIYLPIGARLPVLLLTTGLAATCDLQWLLPDLGEWVAFLAAIAAVLVAIGGCWLGCAVVVVGMGGMQLVGVLHA
ncbi:hypothetical protein U1Q18_025062 [Sarracenia purpurea var. burkii]